MHSEFYSRQIVGEKSQSKTEQNRAKQSELKTSCTASFTADRLGKSRRAKQSETERTRDKSHSEFYSRQIVGEIAEQNRAKQSETERTRDREEICSALQQGKFD